MTQEEIKMDTVTFSKLEYIVSGSKLTKNELYEIADLMEQFAKEQLATLTARVEELTRENERLTERMVVLHDAYANLNSKMRLMDEENARLTERLNWADAVIERLGRLTFLK